MTSPTTKDVRSGSSRGARSTVQLVAFFVITFLIAWAAWVPVFRHPNLPGQIAFIGLFAPALAAFLTAGAFGGVRTVTDILRRLAIIGLPPRWVVLSLVAMPSIYVCAMLAVKAAKGGGMWPRFAGNSPMFIATAFVWLLFVNSGEELGWRGFALPRMLESSHHPVVVSLALGFVWGVWHLPLYLLPGQSAFPFPLFLIFTSLQSVLYTAIFIHTRGSLLPAILLHAGTDIAPRIFQLTQLPSLFWLVVDLTLGLVVVALLPSIGSKTNSAQQPHTRANSTSD